MALALIIYYLNNKAINFNKKIIFNYGTIHTYPSDHQVIYLYLNCKQKTANKNVDKNFELVHTYNYNDNNNNKFIQYIKQEKSNITPDNNIFDIIAKCNSIAFINKTYNNNSHNGDNSWITNEIK